MGNKLAEIAERIQGVREILELSVEDMAQKLGVSVEEYEAAEAGKRDFSFTFLFKCAEAFGMDMVELITGEKPKLSFYSIVRAGTGLPIERRKGFGYNHLASTFRDKLAEPFLVKAPYDQDEQDKPIHLSSHEGQEFDYVLKGKLKVAMEGHIEVLGPGDAIYYNSAHGHGMIATDGEDCEFLAVVIKSNEGENR